MADLWERCGINKDIREYYGEFATATHSVAEASVERRPDAVSLAYLTAHAIGPETLADSSKGLLARVWRVRLDGAQLWLERSNAANDAWEEPSLVTTLPWADGVEIDVAFDQNANINVCIERQGRVYLWWFDPVVSNYVLADFGPGRTPRILLDDPERVITGEPDVLLFYLREGLRFREQSDRYTIENATPVEDSSNLFLEDVFLTTDRRVRIVLSIRNVAAGTYQLTALESKAYPFITQEPWALGHPSMLGGFVWLEPPEPWVLDYPLMLESRLAELVLNYELTSEPWELSYPGMLTSLLKALVLNYTLYHPEPWQLSYPTLLTSSMPVVVIFYTLRDPEPWQLTYPSMLGGTLETV